jgi:hypothetical protein
MSESNLTMTPTTGWEYTYLVLKGITNASLAELNVLAKQGWRLAEIIPPATEAQLEGGTTYLAVLERPLPAVSG